MWPQYMSYQADSKTVTAADDATARLKHLHMSWDPVLLAMLFATLDITSSDQNLLLQSSGYITYKEVHGLAEKQQCTSSRHYRL